MNAMDIDEWLRDTEVEPPCGPNLEYDEQFMALASAAAGKPEQQYGETVIPAVGPDWKAVLEQSTQLLSRTKDLRTTILLTRALTRLEGLPGFVRGVELTRRLLETRWDEVHPRLVIDGEADPVIRANALAGLADEAGLLRDLRTTTLISTPVGPLSVRTAEAVLKRDTAIAAGITEAQLAAAAANADGADAPVKLIPTALEHCRAIASLATDRMGTVDAPDLLPVSSLFETLVRVARPVRGNGEAKLNGDTGAAAQPVVVTAGIGELRTRQDAIRALDAVCEFLSASEPSNPAPLLIRRAKRLIGSDFIDIMREIAPDAMANVEAIAGLKAVARPNREE
jgi:type VI secretion system protein ImpA